MRVLCVEPGPQFSVQDVHNGWVRAFRNLGVEVVDLNLAHRLAFYNSAAIKRGSRYRKALTNDEAIALAAKGIEVAAFEMWPDLVVVTSAFFVPTFTLELLRKRGMKVAVVMTESPYEDDAQIRKAPFADLVLLNDPTNIDLFRRANPNTHYMPHAFDPAVHYRRPADDRYASDFCFVGTGFPSRVEFLEKVDWSGLDVALAGNWQAATADSPLRPFVIHPIDHCIDNAEAVDLYSNCKASANLYRREANRPELVDGWACGPREIELAACRTFFARDARPEGDLLFPMLPTFSTPAELGDIVRWAVANEHSSQRAAEAAQAAVADRTFDNNARKLLALVA